MKRLIVGVCAIAVAAGLAACQPKDVSNVDAAGTPTPAASSSPAVPSPSAAAATSAPPSSVPPPSPALPPKPVCKEGTKQLEVEQILNSLGGYGKLAADGEQSEADCAAIKKFQSRFGLRPVDGVPGPATYNVAKRIQASDPAKCNAGQELTACIDLTNQTTYLMKDGKVIYGPTVTRTGYDHPDGKGAPTPAGSFRIIERQRSNWTESFEVYLHYWQRIMGNNGFHQTTTYIHDMSLGSHGCVNLLKADAIKYWETLKVGTPVKVFGRRPGT